MWRLSNKNQYISLYMSKVSEAVYKHTDHFITAHFSLGLGFWLTGKQSKERPKWGFLHFWIRHVSQTKQKSSYLLIVHIPGNSINSNSNLDLPFSSLFIVISQLNPLMLSSGTAMFHVEMFYQTFLCGRG